MTDGAHDPRDERRVAEALDVRFERADVAPGVVARWAAVLLAITVVFAAISVWLLVFLRRREEARDPKRPALYYSDEQRQPEGVRLQAMPFQDLQTLRAQERQILGTYGWVDPAAGVVHIPIDQAMRLYIARQAGASAPSAAASPPPAEGVPTDSAPVPSPATGAHP